MSASTFVKRYGDPARADAARAHLRWLTQLRSEVRLPQVQPTSDPRELVTEHLNGRSAEPGDLPEIAAALGRLHGAAYSGGLREACLDRPFHAPDGLIIPAFTTGRETALAQLRVPVERLPVAIYKDTNLRNVIITGAGPALVDFDDLTLAPFGYDLAKLLVSTAMTYGLADVSVTKASLGRYNDQVTAAGGLTGACTLAQLAVYAEIHHLLTRRYLHRNGYRYLWPAVRPWSNPCPLLT